MGDPEGGHFRLGFKISQDADPVYTEDLDYRITAADLQAALEKVDGLNPGDIVVSLGYGADSHGEEYFLGRWLIEFTGQYAGNDVELLVSQNSLTGTAEIEIAPVEIPVDSGRTELVRCLLPLGTPTPAKAGAIGHASWLHGFQYCITALEPRHVDLIAYGSTYGVT